MIARDEATIRQIQAADPAGSTWLSANAGSGKTRVLTDRVARLLLAGTPPQNILCLTFTKAAASEMQNRLFRRLGEWAMAPEAELRSKLAVLGADDRLGAEDLARSRTLFARAVETPGGLKIQTIHSFCAAILRRFPLEAGVSPNFAEMEERAVAELRGTVLRDMAEATPEVLAEAAEFLAGGGLSGLISAVAGARDAFAAPMSWHEICAALNLDPDLTSDAVVARTLSAADQQDLLDLVPFLRRGGSTDQKLADTIAGLPDPAEPGAVERYCRALLNKDGTIPKRAATKAVADAAPDLVDALTDLRERLFEAIDTLRTIATADRTGALHRFAGAFLDRYAAAKAARGWLDFDDLIVKTRDLLRAPGLADWVLFRLDGGIDHILVDEAQDTSPAQWDVIGLLADEIAAGSGRVDAGQRTLFVVGDQKQSIYSFQGADPQEFDRMRAHFATALRGGTGLTELELTHSFRSAPPVLQAVDLALSDRAGLGGKVDHAAFHETMPGRVDLWPIARSDGKAEDAPWYDPMDRVLPGDGRTILADHVAHHIRQLIDDGATITDQGGAVRAVSEGDFLILVRSRMTPLFESVIAACKREGLAIAGADRLKLEAELAVRDICALLSFLATPEDDLSLAAVLRSPLLGWSEGDLFRLAQPRNGQYLWEALRNAPDHPDTLALLHDMLNQTDFLRPFELIERLLIRHNGRQKLLGRLGVEAEDGIDMLLAQALSYETSEVPSLTGFLEWLDAANITVKRQTSSGGDKIRVMTVHGAKGLESPIVILPDTIRDTRGPDSPLLSDEAGRVFWKPAAPEMPIALHPARDMAKAKDAAEEERLLYVAMTRAESWLIVAGAWDKDKLPAACWYTPMAEALERLDAGPLMTPLGPGKRVELGHWPIGAPRTTTARPTPACPGWVDRAPPRRDQPPAPVAPSDLGGAKALPGDEADVDADTAIAMARGTDVHLLLERLADVPRDLRGTVAARTLPYRSAEDRRALLAEAAGVLDAPALAGLFGPDTLAEVALAVPIPEWGGRVLHGVVDRLILRSDSVLAIDFKTNAMIPDRAEDVPDGLLRQMGAYAAALAQIYGGRRIETAILWTRAARLQHLPPKLTTAAFARAELP